LTLLAALLSVVGLPGCGKMEDPWKGKSGSPRVVASFPPVASWVMKLSDDRAAVITLCTTMGPHEYSFNPRDTVLMRDAQLLVANGLGLDDSFTDRLNSNSGNSKLCYCRLAAQSLSDSERIKNENYVPGKHDHEDGECCGGHGPHDPHAWLGLPQAIHMVKQLREELKEVDPDHTAAYNTRTDAYVKELQGLLAEGCRKLKGLRTPVITHHESMGYFAAAFKLNVIGSVRGLDGQDAGSKKLAELAKKCEGHRRVILTIEPQYPASTADHLQEAVQSIDRNLKVIVVKLDPLETCADPDDLTADWYVRKMRQNIDALVEAAR
jgi:ABC-type Zn uptake system ZnuABC Zn-binding protein ZnuA